ncbi:hypothetical protein GEV33_003662 [Tenebrio molitor]|uniref:Reverse transcriptase domain-containing protein n=1 Tax=Tenebrio molitor TaxID=7067 RepID=A0A8J6LE20_TENMO|nr:hypothetical protein GEV33_003662 [Tenebrio molitor]
MKDRFVVSMASTSASNSTKRSGNFSEEEEQLLAFDRIDHGLLLIKLESFGFSDNLVELIRSYLSDRFMYVGVNGYASKPFKQESGVPQGSVLGPLFFNIFINDLVDDLDVPHLLFADDMKIYLTIDSIDDALRLQGCIEEISRRCKLNNLVLNHLKCSIVSFTRKTKPLLVDYKINGSILTRRESIRDLGVIFDSKLSFGEHIRTIAGTAFRALGFVLRAGREFSDVTTLKLLYITYVRYRLEYASLVWSPIYDVHSSLLERVQRRFLKNVVFMLNGEYPPRGCPQGLLLGEFSWKVERRQASPPWIMADEASAYVRFYQFLCSLASTPAESTTRLSIAVCCPGGLAYPGSPSVPAYTRAHAVI